MLRNGNIYMSLPLFFFSSSFDVYDVILHFLSSAALYLSYTYIFWASSAKPHKSQFHKDYLYSGSPIFPLFLALLRFSFLQLYSLVLCICPLTFCFRYLVFLSLHLHLDLFYGCLPGLSLYSATFQVLLTFLTRIFSPSVPSLCFPIDTLLLPVHFSLFTFLAPSRSSFPGPPILLLQTIIYNYEPLFSLPLLFIPSAVIPSISAFWIGFPSPLLLLPHSHTPALLPSTKASQSTRTEAQRELRLVFRRR